MIAIFSVLLTAVAISFLSYQIVHQDTETELNNEMACLVPGFTVDEETYLALLIEEDFENRITLIAQDGTVLYDNEIDYTLMENHGGREEVLEALATGEGRASRSSDTMSAQTYYYAVQLDNGNILRLASSYDSIYVIMQKMLPWVLMIIVVVSACCLYAAHRQTKRIVAPINDLDLNKPLENHIYKEFEPLLSKMNDNEKLRREFFSNVSHELKTPLTSISGYAELMQNDMVKKEDIPAFAGKMYEESQHLIALIEDIMEIYRLGERGHDFPWENIDLHKLAATTILRLEPLAKKKNITVTLTGETVITTGNSHLINEIWYNLIDNAIKYTPENGEVIVTTLKEDNKAVMKVKDNGIGIPEQYLDRVFERFFRVDQSHARSTGGTGLGLAIVKHSASCLNGVLSVESTLGEGTEISIKF
jgi:two-component system phosphate regulon sensor histidine kinase PhoR